MFKKWKKNGKNSRIKTDSIDLSSICLKKLRKEVILEKFQKKSHILAVTDSLKASLVSKNGGIMPRVCPTAKYQDFRTLTRTDSEKMRSLYFSSYNELILRRLVVCIWVIKLVGWLGFYQFQITATRKFCKNKGCL